MFWWQVATFILQKILLDETGLSYICQTYERFSHVAMILVSDVHIFHVILCHCCVYCIAQQQECLADVESADGFILRPFVGTTLVCQYQKKHSPTHLSWSSTILYQLLPSTTIYSIPFTCLTIFLHNLQSTSSLVYLLIWSPPPHIPYISFPNSVFFSQHMPMPSQHVLL